MIVQGIAVHYVTEPDEHISIVLPSGSAVILRRGQGEYLFDRLAWELLHGGKAIWGKEDRVLHRKVPKGARPKVSLEDLGLKPKPTLEDLFGKKEKENDASNGIQTNGEVSLEGGK